MGQEAGTKPAANIRTVHLAVIIAGAPFGLEHHVGSPHPTRGRYGMDDDETQAFASRFVYPWPIFSDVPRAWR